MSEFARGFGDYVAAISSVMGVALIATLILLALSRVTFPTLRHLWHRASPLGRLFGALLFLVCSINATTKAPSRTAPKRVAASAANAAQATPTRIEKWFRRGAWRDDHYLKFETDWVFPHGTNHYSGIWIYSWGKLAAPRTRQSFAALGIDLALFPEESEVTWERTSSNSYRIAWQNGFPDRRSRENGMSASFELFRNGGIAITTNNVTQYIERELPFDCAGRGQDTAWVAANFPNAADAILEAGGYAAWVDQEVGIGLENGLYRFTATFPTTPLEAIELFVGPYTVAVTNAGDYVFLLEKGRDYTFGTRPYIADVTYSAVDDLRTANNLLRSASGWRGSTWNTVGGGLEWTLPTETIFGKCCWLPYFKGAPDLPYLSSDALPSVFEGVLSDAVDNLGVSYEWRSDYNNLEIKTPNERETEVSYKDGSDWRNYALSVTATLGDHKLTSAINGHFWTNSVVEETSLTVTAPKVLFLPFNIVDEEPEGLVTLNLQLPDGESGELSIECVSGVGAVQFIGETSWQVENSVVKTVSLVAQGESSCKDDVKLKARFVSGKGEVVEQETMLTVAKIWYRAEVSIPKDRMRRKFAVGETVLFLFEPDGLNLNLLCSDGVQLLDQSDGYRILLPTKATKTTIIAEIEDATLKYTFDIVEPQLVRAASYKGSFPLCAGKAGGFGIVFAVQVLPTDVSFRHLEIKEVPEVATDATGYFAQPQYVNYLDHGKHGAGNWVPLNDYNGFNDTASVPYFSPPWLEGGSFTWPIPCAWRFRFREENAETIFTQYTQRFELGANGTVRIKKFGYCAERTTNDVHHITGDTL